ncbi:DUF2971 domain-containing protein [Methylocaldum sp.]|uniref:DUF2971 domain-containing protein n=1 Tax=Methylocaldum sp. TaxID=1969727 RepID=UPI002D4DF86C|nr:DUF2971 domain-containing protein [Methylocaldum sp.]HYE36852.1 DUF2971 domain-containing protein [Methylocaldum sp.]
MIVAPKTEGVLFHYTTHDALHSIVENRNLRATNAYYLNDSNEIVFAINHFQRLLDAAADEAENTKIANFYFELSRWLYGLKTNAHYIFVFSLSEHRNLLSQWRAYTKHGSGVSIGFNVTDLERLAARNQLSLTKCIYERDECQRRLANELERIKSEFLAAFPHLPTEYVATQVEYLDFLNRQAEPLLKVFCALKDSTFREEGEWRLISKYYKYYTDPSIKFRPSKSTLIPFIEIDISEMRDDGLLFEQVYPGPSPNFDLSFQAISAFLSNKRACNVTINPQSSWTER